MAGYFMLGQVMSG